MNHGMRKMMKLSIPAIFLTLIVFIVLTSILWSSVYAAADEEYDVSYKFHGYSEATLSSFSEPSHLLPVTIDSYIRHEDIIDCSAFPIVEIVYQHYDSSTSEWTDPVFPTSFSGTVRMVDKNGVAIAGESYAFSATQTVAVFEEVEFGTVSATWTNGPPSLAGFYIVSINQLPSNPEINPNPSGVPIEFLTDVTAFVLVGKAGNVFDTGNSEFSSDGALVFSEKYGGDDYSNPVITNYVEKFSLRTNENGKYFISDDNISDVNLSKYLSLGTENSYYSDTLSYSDIPYAKLNNEVRQSFTGIPSDMPVYLAIEWDSPLDYVGGVIKAGTYPGKIMLFDDSGEPLNCLVFKCGGKSVNMISVEFTITPRDASIDFFSEAADGTKSGMIVMNEERLYSELDDGTPDPYFGGHSVRIDDELAKDGIITTDIFSYWMQYGFMASDLQHFFARTEERLSSTGTNVYTFDTTSSTQLIISQSGSEKASFSNQDNGYSKKVFRTEGASSGNALITIYTVYSFAGGTTTVQYNGITYIYENFSFDIVCTDIAEVGNAREVNVSFSLPTEASVPIMRFSDIALLSYDNENQLQSTEYSTYFMDASGSRMDGNVEIGKILKVYLTFNQSDLNGLQSYRPVFSGNSELYSAGYESFVGEDKDWLINNKNETNYGVVLLSSYGAENTVAAASKALPTTFAFAENLKTDAERYMSLTNEQKKTIFDYLCTVKGGSIFDAATGVSGYFNELTSHDQARAMVFYYGNAYSKDMSSAETAEMNTYYLSTLFYGSTYKSVKINPRALSFTISKTSESSRYSEERTQGNFNNIPKNEEEYGFPNSFTYDLFPLLGGNIPDAGSRTAFILYDLIAALDYTIKLYEATDTNLTKTISVAPVLCRLFNSDDNPSADDIVYGGTKYKRLRANDVMDAGQYFFLFDYYFNNNLISPSAGTAVMSGGRVAIEYTIGNVLLKMEVTAFSITKKKLSAGSIEESTLGNYFVMQKTYDGLLQVNPTEGNKGVFVAGKYPIGKTGSDGNPIYASLVGYNKYPQLWATLNAQIDLSYIGIYIKPVFGNNGTTNADAANDKDIIISFGFYFPDDPSWNDTERDNNFVNYQRALENFELPDNIVFSGKGTISKREIDISFDLTSSVHIDDVLKAYFNDVQGRQPTNEELTSLKAIIRSAGIYPYDMVVQYVTPYGSPLYDLYNNKQFVFGERNSQNLVQATKFVRRGEEQDVFGNYIYDEVAVVDSDGNNVLIPEIVNYNTYFVGKDDPYDGSSEIGSFSWQDFVNMSFYGIGSEQSLEVSGYYYNDGFKTKEITDETPGASKYTLGSDTLPTGTTPGVPITLRQAELQNYTIKPAESNTTAYMIISKMLPKWEANETQSTHYTGKANSYKNAPTKEEYGGNESLYNEALSAYNKTNKLLTINLDGHGGAAQLLRWSGSGINLKVEKYALPTETVEDLRSLDDLISEYPQYASWLTKIRDEGEIKNAGIYYIALSLPETGMYSKSETKYVTLTVNRGTITAYLSPSGKEYNTPNPYLAPDNENATTVYSKKTNFNIKDSWGWTIYTGGIDNYSSTLIYQFATKIGSNDYIMSGITPESIIAEGFDFTHCGIAYGDLRKDSAVAPYIIMSEGGDTFNFTFKYESATLEVVRAKAHIKVTNATEVFTLEKDYGGAEKIYIAEVEYDSGQPNWSLIRFDGSNGKNPLAVFKYLDKDGNDVVGIDLDSVQSAVVGYIYMDSYAGYLDSLKNHFGDAYITDEDGTIKYIMDGDRKTIGFFPQYGETDLTPPDRMKNASFSGYYIMRLYVPGGSAINYSEPSQVFILLKINYSDMFIETPTDAVTYKYTGIDYVIDQGVNSLVGSSFYTNNLEVTKFITIYSGTGFSYSNNVLVGLNNKELMRGAENPNSENAIKMSQFSYENTGIVDVGYYLIEITFAYTDSDQVQNYRLPDEPKAYIYVKIEKSIIKVHFETAPGDENWVYNGQGFGLLDPDAETGQGVTYRTEPGIRYVRDSSGTITGYYYEVTFAQMILTIYKVNYMREDVIFTYDETSYAPGFFSGELDAEYHSSTPSLSSAVDAGIYLFVLRAVDSADGNANKNYSSSAPIFQYFTIKKAVVNVSVQGKLTGEGSTRYALSKQYGEDIPYENFEVTYSGWKNGESQATAKGFTEAEINWGGVSKVANAGTYSIFAKNETGCYNYMYNPVNVNFVIARADTEVWVNESYAESTYTGKNHTESTAFKSNRAPNEGETDMPFAFSLNYNPAVTSFTITVIGLWAGGDFIEGSSDLYDSRNIDTSVRNCINVGVYIVEINVGQSTNYNAINGLRKAYTIVKAPLTPVLSDATMTYGDARYPDFYVYYTGFVGKDAEGLTENNKPVYAINPDGAATLYLGTAIASFTGLEHISIETNDAIYYRVDGYTITVSGGISDNYYFKCDGVVANLMIKQREIEVESSGVTISREYDMTARAFDKNGNSVINSTHYVYKNQIGTAENPGVHPMRPNAEADVINLTFSAFYSDAEVGRGKTVTFAELGIDNPNYILTTKEFSSESGEITAYNPIIILSHAKYTYDGTQKVITPIVTGYSADGKTYDSVDFILRYQGNSSAGTNYPESDDAPRMAGTYVVSVTTRDPNYVVRIVQATLIIEKAEVNINIGGDSMQSFGSVTGLSAVASGLMGYQLLLTPIYIDAEGNQVADISKADAGTYTAKAVYSGSANYNAKTVTETLTIMPVTVNVVFSIKESSFTYDGNIKAQVATFIGVNGLSMNTKMEYYLINSTESLKNADGNLAVDPINVGKYQAYAVSPSGNYVLTGELVATFEIVKCNLIIGIRDAVIDEESSFSPVYINTGIVSGQTERDLLLPPSISYYDEELYSFVTGYPTKSGVYRVKPVGADDPNYNISYAEGQLTVNKVAMAFNTDKNAGVILEGSFDPNLAVQVNLVHQGGFSLINTYYKLFKEKNAEYKDTELGDIYEVASSSAVKEQVRLRLKMNSTSEVLRLALIHDDGSISIVEVDKYSTDGYAEFYLDELTSFAIIRDAEARGISVWVYFAIGFGVLLIIGALIFIKKRN